MIAAFFELFYSIIISFLSRRYQKNTNSIKGLFLDCYVVKDNNVS